jgi:hypothetical protein
VIGLRLGRPQEAVEVKAIEAGITLSPANRPPYGVLRRSRPCPLLRRARAGSICRNGVRGLTGLANPRALTIVPVQPPGGG